MLLSHSHRAGHFVAAVQVSMLLYLLLVSTDLNKSSSQTCPHKLFALGCLLWWPFWWALSAFSPSPLNWTSPRKWGIRYSAVSCLCSCSQGSQGPAQLKLWHWLYPLNYCCLWIFWGCFMNASISNLVGDASLWAQEFALWGILLLTEHQEAALLIVSLWTWQLSWFSAHWSVWYALEKILYWFGFEMLKKYITDNITRPCD